MFLIPDVLDLTELREVRALVESSPFVDGKTTAGYRAKRVKDNEQLSRNCEEAEQAKQIVLTGLNRNPTFKAAAIPRRVQKPMISRYRPGMQYGRHVDDALMGDSPKHRTDLSVTVFLNDPGDYEGGELLVESSFGEQSVKLPAGAGIVYASGALHRVANVTSGERLAAVTWVESYVRDPGRRELLHDLDRVCKAMAEKTPELDETDLAFKSYSNLLRMWSES